MSTSKSLPRTLDAWVQHLGKLPLPIEQLDSSLQVDPPALIKGYLRLGARVLGAPAWDPDFNTADFMMLLSIDRMSPRYARHFGFI